MSKLQIICKSISELAMLQPGWSNNMPHWLQFVLLVVSTFLVYGIYKGLGGFSFAQINLLLGGFFRKLPLFVSGIYILIIGSVGVYISLITASLIGSLVQNS